jgi:hypothetical protein
MSRKVNMVSSMFRILSAVLFAIIAFVASAYGAEFDAAIGVEGSGRCHMDSCDFFIIDAVAPLGSSKRGTLFIVGSRLWSDGYKPTEDDHEYDRPPISVGSKTSQISMVFCSKTDPAVLDYYEKGWHAGDLRPGDESSVLGFNESAYQFYYAACHHFITKDPVSKAMALKLGYTFANHPGNGNLPDDKRQPIDFIK